MPMLQLVRRMARHTPTIAHLVDWWTDDELADYLAGRTRQQLRAELAALEESDLTALVLEVRQRNPHYGRRRTLTVKCKQ